MLMKNISKNNKMNVSKNFSKKNVYILSLSLYSPHLFGFFIEYILSGLFQNILTPNIKC